MSKYNYAIGILKDKISSLIWQDKKPRKRKLAELKSAIEVLRKA